MQDSMIKVSEAAFDHIVTLRQEQGYDETYGLRVSVEGGGCSGLSYKLDFDNQKTEKDKTFGDRDEKIVVDPGSYLYLIGLTLDYEGGLNGKGFVFQNPNASKTCGCGASFNV